MTAKKMGTGEKVGLGVGMVTVAALVGAAGYYLYGKDGEKNRKKVKTLAMKVHAEVLTRAKKLKNVSKNEYQSLVDVVTKKYDAIKSIDKEELHKVALDLKKHWDTIEREAKRKNKVLVRKVKKVAKR